ncbi:MAG: molybdate ABC transporter permease subunit [Terriglobia bacterium]
MTEIELFPFWLSLKVATLATLVSIIVGLPFAHFLAKKRGAAAELVVASTLLPIVLPPTVLGYYLLVLLGRNSVVGQAYESVAGSPLVFTWQGAVIASAVASSPFLIRTALAAVQSVPKDMEEAARTLGLSELRIAIKITLPLAWKGITAGVVLTFAKAIGEFGATLMVAGNIPGETQTLPIAIYDSVQAGRGDVANFLSISLAVSATLAVLLVSRLGRTRL